MEEVCNDLPQGKVLDRPIEIQNGVEVSPMQISGNRTGTSAFPR
jgi:hypothetical protein